MTQVTRFEGWGALPRRMQPLSGDSALSRFSLALRDLQERTGGTVALAQRYGASRTAVYEALAAKRLPSVGTLELIVIAWGADDELSRWRTLRRRAEGELAAEGRLRGEVKVKKTPEEEEFQFALRRLRKQAGNPSQNSWGYAAGLSPRTVSSYLDGDTLPTPGKFNLLVGGLAALCSDREHLEDWILEQRDTMRGEHLHRARAARKEAREQARVLASALPGGQPSSKDRASRFASAPPNAL